MAESSREYFESIGAGWDELRRGFYSDHVRERALNEAAVVAGRVAADVGSGTGFLTRGLLERGLQVIAIDPSPAMLDALARRFPFPGRVDCRIGEAEHLPLADGAVDYCLANMCLHHVASPPAAIREMVRVLAPGGRLVITDLDRHDHEALRDEHHDRWMGFERSLVARWLRDAGLREVRVAAVGEDCCAASRSGAAIAVGIFVASGAKAGLEKEPR